MHNCPSCGTANQSGAKFCLNCGNTLTNSTQSPYQSPHSQQSPPMISEFLYAGFWKRLLAYIVDAIIIYLVIIGLSIAFGLSNLSNNLMVEQNPASSITNGFIFLVAFYFIWWMYFAVQEGSAAQATLGKRLLGIKVADMQGMPLSFAHAAGRQLAGVVSSITFSIGYLMAAFTGRKQALHDIIASAVVVNRRFAPQQIALVNQSPPAGMSLGGVIAVVCLVLIIPVGGIVAAIAIPAYQDYVTRAQLSAAIIHASLTQPAIIQYAEENGNWPVSFEQISLVSANMKDDNYYIKLEREGTLVIYFSAPTAISHGSIALLPELNTTGEYTWQCQANNIQAKLLPANCQ
ncbi:RDD family protein [Aliikangiella maris]|uniref:RDD family protein n=2 Tax=Aliikangiella maris TaxID=3162458 RepID=A0ABV3MS15_9GAMM